MCALDASSPRAFHRSPAASALPQQANVFNRRHKRLQKNRAALLPNSEKFDYLRNAVAERLCDRLHDLLDRTFPTVVDVGSSTSSTLKYLQPEKFGVERIVKIDSSENALYRDAEKDDELRVAPTRICVDEEDMQSVLEPGSADLIISNLGLHWVNDLPGVMEQMRRALKPDGLILASMFGEDTLWELRAALQLAEMEREGGIGVHVSPMTRVADIGNILTRLKYALPTVDQETLTISYTSPFGLLTDLRAMGESSCVVQRRPRMHLDTMFAGMAAYQEMFGNEEDKSVPATFQVIYMIGWAPHESQQRPKERGSQEFSLKELGDVVGTLE